MAKKRLDGMLNIEEDALPSNSKASQKVAPIRPVIMEEGANIEEPVEVTRRIKVKAIRRKKSLTRSIRDTFVNDDTKSVGQYILFEVLIPAAKSMVQDMVTKGIEMFLYGESGGGRRSRDNDRTIVSYGSMYKKDRHDPERYRPSPKRDKFDLGDIFFHNHTEAENVLEQMCDQLEKYDEVTVADYFDFAGVNGATWVHAKWGWTNLKRASCTHTRYGYAIILPEPMELN